MPDPIDLARIRQAAADQARVDTDQVGGDQTGTGQASGGGATGPAAPGATAPPDAAPRLSEEALALLFADKYATSLRYVAMWNKWLIFNGSKWEIDETRKVFSLARALCRQESIRTNKPSVAKAIASAETRAAVVSLSSEDRRLAATTDQWDTDLWLLNTPGGVIDLRTGERRDHRFDDYMTKMTAVTPDATCPIPIWKAFLKKTTAENNDLERFHARVGGYSLTGLTFEQQLFLNYGSGGNGKGVHTNTLIGILADYHTAAPSETFTSSTFDRHPTEVADLRGARLVTAETEGGKQWNETRIKQITGEDPIKARFMRQDFFEYLPQFKLMISGNHKPGINAVNEAIKRRMNLIPFVVTIPPTERDERLADKLKTEWPGILAWLIEGCLEWQRIGLKPPQVVIDATNDYLEEEDVFGRWIEECFDLDINAWTSSEDMFVSWKHWAETNKEKVGSQTALSTKIGEHGFKKQRDSAGDCKGFAGVKLKIVLPVVLTMHLEHETAETATSKGGALFSAPNISEPVWLPKALIEMEPQGNGFYEVTIPGWLAKQKGLHAGGGATRDEAAEPVDNDIPF